MADTGPVTHDRMNDGSTDEGAPPRSRRWTAIAIGAAVWAAASVLAFAGLDPILAAFLVILGASALISAAFALDWDRHSTFEERELARSRKRAVKWERGKDARARDRARWEAHQARQARKGNR